MRFIALTLISLMLITNIALAYPIIISKIPINHTQAKQLVYSVPEQYYEYVDVIEFKNNPTNKYWGYAYANWDKHHNCYSGKIWIYWDLPVRDKLLHELGHIYDFCINKVNVSTEEFADRFEIR